MKHKVSELTGTALDWAVAKAEGLNLVLDPMGFGQIAPRCRQAGWWVWEDGRKQIIGVKKTTRSQEEGFSPSTDWAQGGPIIEQYQITVTPRSRNDWEARIWSDEIDDFITVGKRGNYCRTLLIAAMRCYVASKFGDEIELPELS